MRRRLLAQTEEAQINLTPLIDVVFVILIMFIVVAPLLEMDQIALAEGPGKESSCISESSPVTLHVYADNRIAYNKTPVTLETLPHYLQRAKEQFPTTRPQLYQDAQASFGTYQAVKNAVEKAGFVHLDVILKPK